MSHELAARLENQANAYDMLALGSEDVDMAQHAADLRAAAQAVRLVGELKGPLQDLYGVGNSYCNEHDDVDCVTCIHETVGELLMLIAGWETPFLAPPEVEG